MDEGLEERGRDDRVDDVIAAKTFNSTVRSITLLFRQALPAARTKEPRREKGIVKRSHGVGDPWLVVERSTDAQAEPRTAALGECAVRHHQIGLFWRVPVVRVAQLPAARLSASLGPSRHDEYAYAKRRQRVHRRRCVWIR